MNLGSAPLAPPAQLPIPMPAFLEGNPYFQAGFGLAIMGFGLQLIRKGGVGLQILAKRQLLTSLEITNRDASFPWITQWLQHTTKGKIRRVTVETPRRQTHSGKSITSYSMVPSQGKHFIKYKVCKLRPQTNPFQTHNKYKITLQNFLKFLHQTMIFYHTNRVHI